MLAVTATSSAAKGCFGGLAAALVGCISSVTAGEPEDAGDDGDM